jgi:hypothetical protein
MLETSTVSVAAALEAAAEVASALEAAAEAEVAAALEAAAEAEVAAALEEAASLLAADALVEADALLALAALLEELPPQAAKPSIATNAALAASAKTFVLVFFIMQILSFMLKFFAFPHFWNFTSYSLSRTLRF